MDGCIALSSLIVKACKVFVVYVGFVQTESGQVLYTTALLQLNQLLICTMISCCNLQLGCG